MTAAVWDWLASIFDDRVSPGDAIVWILLATVVVIAGAGLFRLVGHWSDHRRLSQHERASQTTTWVLVVLAVSLVAISSALAVLTGPA